MTPRLATVLVLLCCVGVLGIAATVNGFMMVDAVNQKLPAGEQFNPIGWFLPKLLRLHTQYRRLYPGGRLLRREGILAATMFFCLVLAAGLIGFGSLAVVWLGAVSALVLGFVYFRN